MKAGWRAGVGAFAFALGAVLRVPHLLHPAWGELLLSFAALVLVPLLLDLLDDADDGPRVAALCRWARWLQFPAALLLLASGWCRPGVGAVLCSLPWASMLVMVAAVGLYRITIRGFRPVGLLCRDFGMLYAAIGAAWLVADRAGLRPLGFDAAIVLLTAVHFHFAGLILPVLAGLALRELASSPPTAAVGVGVILGVPAVAVGITASQLGIAPFLEVAAALLMAASGLGVAALHAWLGLRRGPWSLGVRCLWVTAAASLAAGMVLAALYGLRSVHQPWPWLDVPWMRALHGTMNALGFGGCGVFAWWLALRSDRSRNFRNEWKRD